MFFKKKKFVEKSSPSIKFLKYTEGNEEIAKMSREMRGSDIMAQKLLIKY